MSMLRKIGITVFVLLAGSILYFYLKDEGRSNLRNFHNLQIGMTENQALQVMGKPNYTLEDTTEQRTIHYYLPPRYYVSDGMKVIVDNRTHRIVRLVESE